MDRCLFLRRSDFGLLPILLPTWIAALFGREIPVVHELEYYYQIADQTLQANHPGVADEVRRMDTVPLILGSLQSYPQVRHFGPAGKS